MPKNRKIKDREEKTGFEKEIMTKISSGEISMKPKWYFVAGSIFGLASLVGLSTVSIFLLNILFFVSRKHGPMGQWKLEAMLASFPWWIPAVAIVSVVLSIYLLRRYDFSYKKNFRLILIGFVVSMIIASWLLNNLGFNEVWSRRGPMRRFYQQLEVKDGFVLGNQKRMENGQGRNKRLEGQ